MTANNPKYDLIISSCDAFSDLWDANISLLKSNWSDINCSNIFLVTDKPTDKSYDAVTVVSSDENSEITDRLKKALSLTECEYVVFTLDDYFFTEKIDTKKIDTAIEFMKAENVDYVQLYPTSKSFLKRENSVESKNFKNFYIRDIFNGNYKVCLTPSIWRVDFMRKTLVDGMNAWQYEVSLTKKARELNAVVALSNNNELPYLDVIRKGKLLRKADRYFKKHPIYKSQREVMKLKDELILGVRVFIKTKMPKSFFILTKKLMIKMGHSFYSPVE